MNDEEFNVTSEKNSLCSEYAPVALFVYNRLEHVQKTIEALMLNELSAQSHLIIFSDGPRNDEDLKAVLEVRRYLKSVTNFLTVRIICQEHNIGLANSITSGVTEILHNYSKVIVLEDDILTSKYFLQYMNAALSLYENDDCIYGVSGHAYPISAEDLPVSYFLSFESSWGWGTWSRAWTIYEKNTEKLLKSFDKKMIKKFNFNSRINFFGQILQNKFGIINTWAIYWYANIFCRNGLFLFPRESFVANIGFDGSGTNCDQTHIYDSNLAHQFNGLSRVKLEEHKIARQRHEDFFRKTHPSIAKRALNKIIKEFGCKFLR